MATPSLTRPTAAAERVPPSTANKVGYVLAVLLSLVGFSSLLVPPNDPGEVGPPSQVLAVGAALGVIELVGVWLGWPRRRRAGARLVAASRILAMLLGLPAFFVDGVAPWIVVEVGVITVASIATAVLVLLRPRRVAG